MQTQNTTAAHILYVLYETLSDENQKLFLQELLTKQKEKVESSLKQSKELSQTKTAIKTNEKNRFADICGILTSEKSVSLEDMERAIALQGVERFKVCV
ncbi:MAG: hypothetical protein WAW61_18505 [Methylococcaceae bacterium]